MHAHGKVRQWRRVPSDPLMNDVAVHRPRNVARSPFDRVAMNFQRRIEPKLNTVWCTTIAIGHGCPIVTGIEVDIDQHARWVAAHEFDVDLLAGLASMQEKSGD